MKKNTICLLSVLLVSTILTGCGGGSLYTKTNSKYKEIKTVPGVQFDVKEDLVNSAAAVSTISENADYGEDTYSYTDGDTSYIIFNINDVIVAMQKNTKYKMHEAEDKESAVEKDDVCGIWFKKDGKNLDYKDDSSNGVYKFIGDVDANVAITKGLYGAFAGKLAVVSDGKTENALFVGSLGSTMRDVSSSEKKMINHVAKSFVMLKDKNKDNTNENALPKKEEKDTSSGNPKDDEISVEEVEVTEDDPTTESTMEPAAEPEVKTSEEPEEKTLKIKERTKAESGTESSLYNLLEIGDTGLCSALGKKTDIVNQEITIKNLYTGKKAERKAKAMAKTLQRDYHECSRSSTCHLIEYYLKENPANSYTDIRIEGFDGEKLTFRGIKHSSRTYDLMENLSYAKDGLYGPYYCYYEVPNGCREYLLRCGLKSPKDETKNAFYKVSGFRE